VGVKPRAKFGARVHPVNLCDVAKFLNVDEAPQNRFIRLIASRLNPGIFFAGSHALEPIEAMTLGKRSRFVLFKKLREI